METHYQIINELGKHRTGVVIYDIDGTLIDHSGQPRQHIIHTYHHALRRGLTPVIITARRGTRENIFLTKKQLAQFGIGGYSGIYFMPPEIDPYPQNQARYKFYARKNIHDKGHKIIASIGDMPWDYGHYGGVGFKV